MKVKVIYDYIDDNQGNGVTLAVLTSEPEETNVEDRDFIPRSIENRESLVRRIATYVSVYGEEAYLYIEESGADINYIKEVLSDLKEAGLDPYEFSEISSRSPGKIEIEESSKGYKLIDRKRNIFFSTNSESNPQELN